MHVSSEQTIEYLNTLSQMMGIDLEVLLSLYLVLQDDIYFVFEMFQGRTLKFPRLNRVKGAPSVQIYELKNRRYETLDGIKLVSELQADDVIEIGDLTIRVQSSPVMILGRYYLIVKGVQDGK